MYIPAPPFVIAFVVDPSVYTLTHDSEGYFSSSMLIVSVFLTMLVCSALVVIFGTEVWMVTFHSLSSQGGSFSVKAMGLTYFGKTSWCFLCKALVSNAKLDLLSLPEESCFNLVFIGWS